MSLERSIISLTTGVILLIIANKMEFNPKLVDKNIILTTFVAFTGSGLIINSIREITSLINKD